MAARLIPSLEHFESSISRRFPRMGRCRYRWPGCVEGGSELHKRFGKLPMNTLLAPAIKYASEGFPFPR